MTLDEFKAKYLPKHTEEERLKKLREDPKTWGKHLARETMAEVDLHNRCPDCQTPLRGTLSGDLVCPECGYVLKGGAFRGL